MSSNSENEAQQQQTHWCHECDISVHLLVTSDSGSQSQLLCPHCRTRNLELMDSYDPTLVISTDTITSFLLDSILLPFFPDESDTIFDGSALPTVRISAEENGGTVCAVCKDEFVINVDDAKLLPCNHLFHPHCILPWLHSNHNSCPLCRFDITPTLSSHFDHNHVGALSTFLPSHF